MTVKAYEFAGIEGTFVKENDYDSLADENNELAGVVQRAGFRASLEQQARVEQEMSDLRDANAKLTAIIQQCFHARQCNAPYGQTEKYPSVEEFKRVLEETKGSW